MAQVDQELAATGKVGLCFEFGICIRFVLLLVTSRGGAPLLFSALMQEVLKVGSGDVWRKRRRRDFNR